jgi:hypothetical protein
MKTYSRSILSTLVITGAIALCSLNVNAATIGGTATHATMQNDTTKMKKEKMQMEKKKMAMMKKEKMKMDKMKMKEDKMKMDKMKDTTSKM